MLKPIERARLTLRHQYVKGLPVPKTEHHTILGDELRKNRECMRIVGRIDGRAAVTSDVQLGGPVSRQGNSAEEFASEHGRINKSFERDGYQSHARSALPSHIQRSRSFPLC